jgi:hypothetical protein
MALIHSMRLSLMKGAHADLSSAAWQEIGVKPFFGLSGIMAVDVPLPVCRSRPREIRSGPSTLAGKWNSHGLYRARLTFGAACPTQAQNRA